MRVDQGELGSPADQAASLRRSSSRLRGAETLDEALSRLVEEARELLPRVTHASVTRCADGSLTTPVASDDLARRCDALQFRWGQGPCIDAVNGTEVVHSDQIASDSRWPKFGAAAAREISIQSMLAVHLVSTQPGAAFGLNLYTDPGVSLCAGEIALALFLGGLGELAIAGAASAEESGHLQRALNSNRDISIAIGIVISQFKVTPQGGFELLKRASQNTHRKLAELAADVIYTGALEVAPGCFGAKPRD